MSTPAVLAGDADFVAFEALDFGCWRHDRSLGTRAQLSSSKGFLAASGIIKDFMVSYAQTEVSVVDPDGATEAFKRALSEVLVFLALGLRHTDCILDEEALKRLMFLKGTKTPEGIFFWVPRGSLVRHFGTREEVRITVEVKRVAFLMLPNYLPSSYRQRYAGQTYWFDYLVKEAIEEITPYFINRFGIQAHILGLAVPMSMPMTDRRELRQAALKVLDVVGCPVPCEIWVVPEPNSLFGRLLKPKAFIGR